MDFDLTLHDGKGGPAKNDYRLISRRIDPRTAWFKVHDAPFGTDNRDGEAREGKALWNAEEFTTLRVQSTEAKNAHRRPIAYDLIPMRLGSVRKLVPKGDVKKLSQEEMDFINHDFFVTHAPAEGAVQPYHKIVSLAARQRPLSGNAATVWYSSPALHVPRSEDFGPNGTNNTKGVALTTWIEFTLRPRDLFDSTPLFLTAHVCVKKKKQFPDLSSQAPLSGTETFPVFDPGRVEAISRWLMTPEGSKPLAGG